MNFSLTYPKTKLLKWVQSAQSKDGQRPILEATQVGSGYVWASDGLAAHATPSLKDELPETSIVHIENTGKTIKPNTKTVGASLEYQATPMEGNSPDIHAMIPAQAPVFEIAVDPKLLIRALKGMEAGVRLRFYGVHSPMEVCGRFYDGEHSSYPAWALIMPMHMERAGVIDWRPE